MALRITTTTAVASSTLNNPQNTSQSEIVTSEYVRIVSFTGDKTSIEVCTLHTDEQTGIHTQSHAHSFVPSLVGDNFIAQGYAYLKTLPQFVGATDC